MSTPIKTLDPELMLIDHLDFDPACQAKSHGVHCERTAEWWVIAKAHCRPDATVTAFWCAHHYDRAQAGELNRCKRCDTRYDVSPLIIRTERIR